MNKYLSITEVAQLLGVTTGWVYKKSKELQTAKVMLNGRAIQPMRFDSERLEALLSGSVTTYRDQKKPRSKSLRKGDQRLWG